MDDDKFDFRHSNFDVQVLLPHEKSLMGRWMLSTGGTGRKKLAKCYLLSFIQKEIVGLNVKTDHTLVQFNIKTTT